MGFVSRFASDTFALDTTTNLKHLANGTMFYALAACIAVMLISASLWALGSQGQNPGQELTGKRGFIIAVVAAFLIGATPAIVHTLDNISRGADINHDITSNTLPPTPGQSSACSLEDSHDGNC